MPGSFKKNDLRVQKTQRAIHGALAELLRRQPFGKITVYDICEQAMVSRTAFYAHYYDKYDLLEQTLVPLRQRLADLYFAGNDQALEDYACGLLRDNHAIIAHVLEDADREVLALLLRFFASRQEDAQEEAGEAQQAFSDFLAGGLWNSVLMQLRRIGSTTEPELRANIRHILGMVRALLAWNREA